MDPVFARQPQLALSLWAVRDPQQQCTCPKPLANSVTDQKKITTFKLEMCDMNE